MSLQHLQKQELHSQLVLDLAKNMACIVDYIGDIQQFARLVQLKTAIEDIQPLLEKTTNFIIQYTFHHKLGELHLLVVSNFLTKFASQRAQCMLCIHHPIKTRLRI